MAEQGTAAGRGSMYRFQSGQKQIDTIGRAIGLPFETLYTPRLIDVGIIDPPGDNLDLILSPDRCDSWAFPYFPHHDGGRSRIEQIRFLLSRLARGRTLDNRLEEGDLLGRLQVDAETRKNLGRARDRGFFVGDLVMLPVQMGRLRGGQTVGAITATSNSDTVEFPLGLLEVASILLANPNLLCSAPSSDQYGSSLRAIDCPGDRWEVDSNQMMPYFELEGDRTLGLDVRRIEFALPHHGIATGFLFDESLLLR
ncbi:MAG: hypothetical protein ABIJ46_05030 [bacterium]